MFGAASAYIGNGHYCYANVTAMLLASIGEQVAPGLIEVLSGVGLGATWNDAMGLIFFDSSPPDVGVSRSIGLLGFEVVEQAASEGELPPLSALAEALASGPAILGPLDIGLLRYQRGQSRASGIDHYVLAYAIADGEVLLHDPAGFPCVSLALDDLVPAWRAELVGYRRGAFRWWHAPRRVAAPTDGLLFEHALRAFGDVYARRERTAATVPGACIGSAAIRRLATCARSDDLPAPLAGHLRAFAFQVGARRALDFAAFFEGRAPELAALKREQAGLFGRAHTLLVRQDLAGLADALTALAAAEDQIHDRLTAAATSA